jgi:hypothetical protein
MKTDESSLDDSARATQRFGCSIRMQRPIVEHVGKSMRKRWI